MSAPRRVKTWVHPECGEDSRCVNCGECGLCLADEAKGVAELKEAGRELYDAWNSDRPHVNKMFRLGRALAYLGVELRPEPRTTHPSSQQSEKK
jgi:hypothetical protein